MKLLITRPQPAASKTAKLAENCGFEPVIMPLFEIHPLEWEPPAADGFDALMFTSANALRQMGDVAADLKALPVIAVGEATAASACEQGYKVVFTGNSGKTALIAEARRRGFTDVLWLAGKDRSVSASDRELITATVAIYESRALAASEDFEEYVAKADLIALHSSRAAAHFRSLVEQADIDQEGISIVTLSRAIAERAGSGWRDIGIAKTPDDAALLKAAQSIAR